MPASHDGLLHLLRLMLLDRHVREGMIFPRWLPELVLGHGYPVFNFYGPSTYYLAEVLHLSGLGYSQALMAAFGVLVVIAGFGMFYWARDLFGPGQDWAALAAATAYMYAPYLLTNVFVRGAIAEVGAQALLPWILWSTGRLMKAERPASYVLPVVLTLGGLAVTHTITLLFVPPLWLAYVLLLWWQGGRRPARLIWAGIGGLGALAISTCFWVPLVIERQYLSQVAYQVSATLLPENVWTWHNFLDTTLLFEYTFASPFRLGLVQVLLAISGFMLARRRDAVWLFLVVVTLVSGFGITRWALPVWLHSRTLLIALFPWRLLGVMSAPLALFVGGLVIRRRPGVLRAGFAVFILALVIVANRPRLDWMPVLPDVGESNALPIVAQFEVIIGASGTSFVQEFRPRWAQSDAFVTSSDLAPGQADVRVRQASSYDLTATVSSATGGPLRFASFYFPGWRIVLDGEQILRPYPSTDLGLLTVDLPPGSHALQLSWAGTTVQHWATVFSLLAMAGLTWFCWRCGQRRWLAVLPLALLVGGLAAVIARPTLSSVQAPRVSISADGVSLLGFRAEFDSARHLLVYPYWYVHTTPSATFRARWQLQNGSGDVVSETITRPYFNSVSASNWPPGTLVDDAYQLPLAPGLSAGIYQLTLQLESGGAVVPQDPVLVGAVELLAPTPPQSPPTHPLAVRFSDAFLLAGYDVRSDGQLVTASNDRPIPVHTGDSVEYTLALQALRPLMENYHSFVHLVDRLGQPLAKHDEIAGTLFDASALWDTLSQHPDRHLLRIPRTAASGLYWPSVGVYDFKTMDRLPVWAPGAKEPGGDYRLPPLKVINHPSRSPQHRASARFADMAALLGHDLTLPPSGLRAGDQFTLTLYYRSETATPTNYTRFVHFYSPTLGMAAQQDSLPQGGSNPTWAWVPGEVIADDVVLTVARETQPGSYELRVGFYDASADGMRLPVQDDTGRPLPDAQVVLAKLDVVER